MVKAVRFHHFGGIDVLQVEDVELRRPAADEVLVRVRAVGINPGEANIRTPFPPCWAGFRTTCLLAGASPWRGSKEASDR